MLRWKLAVVLALAASWFRPAFALDGDKDKDELRAKILKKVEERLKEENKRVLDEVKKILDEELGKMEEDEPQPKKPEPKKPEPKKPEPKKPEPKKPEPKAEEPGYMGVYPEDITDSMRKLLKLGEGEGVLISGLAEDGPAAKAGLKANDIVLAVDGEAVGSAEELREQVTAHHAGETVKLTVLRKKEKVDVKVKLAPREAIEPSDEGGEEGGMEEGEEGEEEEATPPKKEEKPAKKPKVVFEPRVEAPKFTEKTAEELRDEIRKFLDQELKSGAPKTKKILLPAGNYFIGDDGDEDNGDEKPAKPGREVRELTKRFLKDLLEKLEQQDAEEGDEGGEEGEDGMPFKFDDELRRMMEEFQKMRGEEFEKLREKMKEQMEKLQDEDYLKKLLDGMDGAQLEEQLKKLLEGVKPGGDEDDEDLTEPEDDQTPKADPKVEPKGSGKAWLGVGPDELSAEMLKQLKIESGVLVREVIANSPAAEAGLKAGDVILSIDGQELAGPEDLQKAIAARKAGADVTLSILRKGKTIEKTVTLAARKKISFEAKRPASLFDTADGPGKKKAKKDEKKSKPAKKQKASKKETKEFDLPGLGMEFAKKQGLRVALLDKNGKVILSEPIEDAQKLMEMARKFGFEMPSGDGEQDVLKLWSGKAGKSFEKAIPRLRELEGKGEKYLKLFHRGDDGKKSKKHDKKQAGKKGSRKDDDGCEECPLGKLMESHKDFFRGGDMRKEIEKAMKKFHGGKGGEKFEFEMPAEMKKMMKKLHGNHKEHNFEFKVEKPKKGHDQKKPKAGKKQEKRFKVELKKDGGKKPSVKIEGDGKFDKKSLDKVLKEVEKAMKDAGGKNVPGELRDELKQLEKELEKLMKKNRRSQMAA